jgi:hypothetical protein
MQQGRFTGTIGAHQCNNLTFINVKSTFLVVAYPPKYFCKPCISNKCMSGRKPPLSPFFHPGGQPRQTLRQKKKDADKDKPLKQIVLIRKISQQHVRPSMKKIDKFCH